jgi:hypothetical protein
MSADVRGAKTYASVAIAWTAVVGVLFLFLGFVGNQMWIMFLGVLSVFLALMAFITTSERLRRGEVEGARFPCIAWGIILLAFGLGAGITFLLTIPPNTVLSLLSFLYVFGGMFMIFAHSKTTSAPAVYPSERRPQPVMRGEQGTLPGGTLPGEIFGYLKCVAGPDQGRMFDLAGQNIRIGNIKDQTNNIQLTDNHVSRTHAMISFTNEGAFIEDLGSLNFTFVNEKGPLPRQQKEKLSGGTQIRLGPYTRLVYSTSTSEDQTAPT